MREEKKKKCRHVGQDAKRPRGQGKSEKEGEERKTQGRKSRRKH